MDKGYAATTVNDVLEAADVAKGTFYHHFSSKEDLLGWVADRIKEKYMGILQTTASINGMTAEEKFVAIEEGISSVEETEWVQRELQCGEVAPALLVNVMRQSFEEALPLYIKIIDEGMEDGTVKTPFPFTASVLLLILNILKLHMGGDSDEELSHFRNAILRYTDDTLSKEVHK